MLITLFTVLIDARLVELQHVATEPLTIDTISVNNVLAVPTMNRAGKTLVHVNTSVCYPVVGCFDNNDPFNNAALQVPQPPELIDTQFLLFTQEASIKPEFLFYNGNDQSITESSLNSTRWLRIIVHGFTNNRDSIWIQPLKDELLKLKDVRTI